MLFIIFALHLKNENCMKVYFYHDQNLNLMYKEWKSGRYPGHFLYGATHLHKYGVDVIMHQYRDISSSFKLAIYTAFQILTCREQYDAIYAASTRGLGLIIFLRFLKIFRKPIITWRQHPINIQTESKLYYKGIDQVLFYSQKFIDEAVKSGIIPQSKADLIHWGADLDFYDKLIFFNSDIQHNGFISTGKDHRDMATLVRAFSATGQPLEIYVASQAYGDNYLQTLNDLRPSSNVKVTFVKGTIPAELAQKVWTAKYVVICCQETNYAVGYTTLIEAIALGMPLICTRNSAYPIDVDSENVGISIPYYDSVALEAAIRNIISDQEKAKTLSNNARQLAEKTYNLENCTQEVAKILKQFR